MTAAPISAAEDDRAAIVARILTAENRSKAAEARVVELEAALAAAQANAQDIDGDLAEAESDLQAALALVEIEKHRAEASEARATALLEALRFYADNWTFTTNKHHAGLEWHPKEALLDDCGNIARAAINAGASNDRK